MRLLNGKVALITGSTHGIGLATAQLFAREGAKVIVSSESQRDCDRIAAGINYETPDSAIAIECDVLKNGAIDQLFDKIIASCHKIDIVCCHVGGGPIMPLSEFTPELIDRVFMMNAQSCYLTCQRAVREMLHQKTGGSIICTTSTANFCAEVAKDDSTYGSTYAGNKRFVATLAKCVARRYADHGIRCNAIAPGPTPEGMLPDIWCEAYRQATPSKQLSRASDHAHLMLFLASERSVGINGCEIPVDGGLSSCLYLDIDNFRI